MVRIRLLFPALALACALVAGCVGAPEKPAAGLAVIPANKDNDLKLYYADGRTAKGADALGRMQQDAELILWLAGNQFFANPRALLLCGHNVATHICDLANNWRDRSVHGVHHPNYCVRRPRALYNGLDSLCGVFRAVDGKQNSHLATLPLIHSFT